MALMKEPDGGKRHLCFSKYLLSVFYVPDLVQALGYSMEYSGMK